MAIRIPPRRIPAPTISSLELPTTTVRSTSTGQARPSRPTASPMLADRREATRHSISTEWNIRPARLPSI